MHVGLAVVAQVGVGVVHSRVVVEHFGVAFVVVFVVVFIVVFEVVLHVVRVVHFGVVLVVVFAVVLTVPRVWHLAGVFGVTLQVVRGVVLLGIGLTRRVVRCTILLVVRGVIRIITGLLGTFLAGLHTAGRFMRMRIAVTFFLATLHPSTELKTTIQAKLGKYILK